MTTYKDKEVSRILLPSFASTLIKSFEEYRSYNKTFSQMKSLHSVDCDSREAGHFLSNIDKLVSDYTAIGYIASRNSKYATKITNKTFKYTYKRAKKTSKSEVKLQTIEDTANLMCYIQYNYKDNFISSSGVVADSSSNRTNLGCSSSSSLPKSEYDSTQDLKFSCNYYICHINEKFNEDTKKIEYKFKYEKIDNQPIKSIIDKYKSQDKSTKDIIYVILNNLTKTRMYDLAQGHTHELLEYYHKTYNDGKHLINLLPNHKPLNVQSNKDALKELNDIDD